MQINTTSTSFNGSLTIKKYDNVGKEFIKKYKTTQGEDLLLQRVADTMTKPGVFDKQLNIVDAHAYMTLLELIIKKPLIDTRQYKLMSNIKDQAVVFGDSQPGLGGFTAILDLKQV